jgi:DNA topoisomerase-1
MVIKTAWRGPFLACSAYPKCRNAKSLTAELREKLKDLLPPPREKKSSAATAVPNVPISETCPECGAAMKLMKSRFGPGYYLGCSQYPKCKGKAKVSPELEAQIAAALGQTSA